MSDEIAIFGFGPVGRATAEILRAQGRAVRIAQRKEPENPPAGAAFVRCDALDGEFGARRRARRRPGRARRRLSLSRRRSGARPGRER